MREIFLKSGAVLEVPSGVLVGWGESVAGANGFYSPGFFLQEGCPWRTYPYVKVFTKEEFRQFLGEGESLDPPEWSVDREAFSLHFLRLKETVASGVLEKAVPYVFYRSSNSMSYERLRQTLLAALDHRGLYGQWEGGQGVVGVTPEKLFSLSDNTLETMALAGTATTFGEKEYKEHDIVVKDIIDVLSPFGKVEVGPKEEIEIPLLRHLKTSISVKGELVFLEAVQALHPTPALGVFPRLKGKEWLSIFDSHTPRDKYGAPFGYSFDGKKGECCVAIRNVQWDETGMRIGVGCGVIGESEEEAEWAEIERKALSVRTQLKL